MTDHKIEYRGFAVPVAYFGNPALLDAWRAGVDRVLDTHDSGYPAARYALDFDGWYFRSKDGVITYLTTRGLNEGEAPDRLSEGYGSFEEFLADWPYDARELPATNVPDAFLDGLNR